MRRYWLIFLLSSLCLTMSANVADDAASLFNEHRYQEASALYIKLLQQNPNSALYHYRYARCLYELGDYELAIHHFELSGERYALRNYYMGCLHETTYRFTEAIAYYDKYAETLEATDERLASLQERSDYCRFMERYMQRVEEVSITDSIIMEKEAFLQAYHLSHEAGTLTQKGEEIQYTNQRNDRKFLARPRGEQIALYASEKLLNQWTEPHLLPYPLNQGNCSYPYIMSDGITMYFASTHNSMGGYDLFITRYNHTTGTYLTPENIGMPFNSPANDYMMVIDENQGLGWWATDRRQPEGKVVVYTFIYKEEKQYVSVSDSLLREKAQLLTFTKKEHYATNSIHPSTQVENIETSDFVFTINNQRTYYHHSDFQSEKALALFQEWEILQDSIGEMKEELKTLRHQYQEGIQEERVVFAEHILELEQKIPIAKQFAEKTRLLILKEENEAIGYKESLHK